MARIKGISHGGGFDYENAPEMIALCTSCTKPDCVELCPERGALIRRLKGLPPADRSVRKRKSGRAWYEMDGERHTLREWAAMYGMNYRTLVCRINRDGMDLCSALTTPVSNDRRYGRRDDGRVAYRGKFEIDGEYHTLKEWCARYGISVGTVAGRIYGQGMDLYTALTLPTDRSNGRKCWGRRIEVDGVALTIKQWAERLGTSVNSLNVAICRKKGSMTAEEIIRERLKRRGEM